MKFELNKVEIEKFEEIKSSIIVLFGEVGDITFSFSNSSGIGMKVNVTFDKHKITKDITDYGSW